MNNLIKVSLKYSQLKLSSFQMLVQPLLLMNVARKGRMFPGVK